MEILLSSVITTLVFLYVQAKIMGKKLNYKSIKFIAVLFAFSIILIVTYNLTQHFTKIILNFTILMIAGYVLHKEENKKIILSTLISFIFLFITEFIFAIGFLLFSKLNIGISEINLKSGTTILPNVIISLMVVVFLNVRSILIVINKMIKNVLNNDNNEKKLFIIAFLLVSFYSIFLYSFYFEVELVLIVVLTLLSITIMTILIYLNFVVKNYSVRLEKEYQELITNLNEYEKFLELYRFSNHENVNNLIILKGLINNEEAIKYIDDIINVKPDEDIELLYKTTKIPTGGLQGLFYQKLLTIKEKRINYHIEISKKIDFEQFTKLDNNSKQSLCKIAAILLDNAIEAVETLNDKYISIYIYAQDDNFVISISNNFINYIEVEKIDNIHYSSKGKNRGYGLSLVREIVSKNKKIKLEREFIGNIFKQKLKIKM